MKSAVVRPETWSPETVENIVARHAKRQGALLPILHEVQAAFGYVPKDAVPMIAGFLNISRADVHGVITFYHDFREAAVERPVVKLCRAEACQARGVDRIAPMLEEDGRIQLDPVYCLGLCASGPAAMVGDRLFARLDEEAVPRVLREALA